VFRNELIPLLADLGIIRAVVLHHINGYDIVTQLHSNNYSFWAYINNWLRDGHVLLNIDGTTNHVNVIGWSEYESYNK